jgi:hypothetical protein
LTFAPPGGSVGDGLCDCCDGTDESEGRCGNTCDKFATESRAQRAEQIRLLEQGAAKKRDYVEQGRKAAGERRAELAAIQAELAGERAALEGAQGSKARAEEAEQVRGAELVKAKVDELRDLLKLEGKRKEELVDLWRLLNKRKDKGGPATHYLQPPERDMGCSPAASVHVRCGHEDLAGGAEARPGD